MAKEKEMRVEVFRSNEKPDYSILARVLLPKIREAFRDPEYVKRYHEWLKEQGLEAEA